MTSHPQGAVDRREISERNKVLGGYGSPGFTYVDEDHSRVRLPPERPQSHIDTNDAPRVLGDFDVRSFADWRGQW